VELYRHSLPCLYGVHKNNNTFTECWGTAVKTNVVHYESPAYNPGVGHIIMSEDLQVFLQYLYLNAVTVS